MFDREFEEQHNISEDLQRLIDRYEAMILDDVISFFEEEEFEQLIEYYEDRNDLDKAFQAVETAIDQYNFSEFFLIKKAELLFEQKQCRKALGYLDKAEILDAGDLEIFLLRSEIYTYQGKFKKAIATLKQALEMAAKEDKDELYLSMSEVYESWEKFDKVFACLKTALEYNPQNEDALNRIWFSVDMIENYEESIEFHKDLIDKDPYSFLAWYNLGQAYYGLGLYEKAAEAFEYVTLINEEYEMVYRDWGEALYRMEDYEKAIEVFELAIRVSEPYEELYFGLGQCYEKINQFNKARYYYRKAAHIDPYYDEAFYKIGELYRKEGRLVEAINSYKKALKLNDENVDYLVAFADASYEHGDLNEAIANYQKVIILKPGVGEYWTNLAKYLFAHGEKEMALSIIEQAIDSCGENDELIFYKTAYLFALGKRNEAIENLHSALSINSSNNNLLFDILPSLRNDDVVLSIIEQYKK